MLKVLLLLFLTAKENFINFWKQIAKIKKTLSTRHRNGARVNPRKKALAHSDHHMLPGTKREKNNNMTMAKCQPRAKYPQKKHDTQNPIVILKFFI